MWPLARTQWKITLSKGNQHPFLYNPASMIWRYWSKCRFQWPQHKLPHLAWSLEGRVPGGDTHTWAYARFPWKCYLFCLNGLGDASSPAGICHLFLEVSPVKSKALRNATYSGFYVFIWRLIKGTGLSISLSTFIIFWTPLPDILVWQSPNMKMTGSSKHTGGILPVVSSTIF